MPTGSTPRRNTGDVRAARTQLKSADQSARTGTDTRADEDALTVPLRDREFRLADDVGIMALMEWVAAAEGRENENAKSLVAIFHVLEDTVHEEDWDDFREYGRKEKVKAPEYGKFINSALEALAGRPTEESTGS